MFSLGWRFARVWVQRSRVSACFWGKYISYDKPIMYLKKPYKPNQGPIVGTRKQVAARNYIGPHGLNLDRIGVHEVHAKKRGIVKTAC